MPKRAAQAHRPEQSRPERLAFRRAPLAAAVLWFAAGIAVERLTQDRAAIHLLAALLVLVGLAVVALLRVQRVAIVAVAGVWVALGFAAAQWRVTAPTWPVLSGYADGLSRHVEGHIVRFHIKPPEDAAGTAEADADADFVPPWESTEAPEEHATGRPAAATVDLAVDAIEDVTPDTSRMVPAAGAIKLTLQTLPAEPLRCGMRVAAGLRLKGLDGFRNPGGFDFAALEAESGIAARASTAGGRLELAGQERPTVACRLAEVQSWTSARLLGFAASPENQRLPRVLRLSEADAQMLDAMLFGDRTGLTHPMRTGFERTGTFHLFVVSGLHIALVAAGVYWLLARLRAPAWLATVLTFAATSGYATLTGFGQPAQRALGMVAVFLLTRLLSRDQDRAPLNALGAAALAMLVWAPASLFDASLQMTVLAIVAIAGIAVPLAAASPLRHIATTRAVFRSHRAPLDPRADHCA